MSIGTNGRKEVDARLQPRADVGGELRIGGLEIGPGNGVHPGDRIGGLTRSATVAVKLSS